jgi:hypothetical protein
LAWAEIPPYFFDRCDNGAGDDEVEVEVEVEVGDADPRLDSGVAVRSWARGCA